MAEGGESGAAENAEDYDLALDAKSIVGISWNGYDASHSRCADSLFFVDAGIRITIEEGGRWNP